ncbi:helix-turn-helix domain-containing protein [Neochlamydia sp. EPS4]|uniref:helix-turn-helix domain-containing protein n=1 Tax=Neochlamydia sp. EPS4 TaxID=1478175 RepID=UPI0005D1278A|nr:helix-turn-helix transcriptional regulator [Neochlamydia sp. EPS4]
MVIKKKQQEIERSEFEISSDNIFADIGVANAEEELTKAELAWEIDNIIKKRKLTQQKAATLMQINQPKVSALLHRKLGGFSIERLIHFLSLLGQDIDIVVKPKPHHRKNARVNVFGHKEYSGILSNSPMATKSS